MRLENLNHVSRQSWAISEAEKIIKVKLTRIQQYVDRFEETQDIEEIRDKQELLHKYILRF